MKARWKRRWAIVLGSVLAAVVLAGCGSARQTDEGKTDPEITLYTIHAPYVQLEEEQTILDSEEALLQFSKEHGDCFDTQEFQHELGVLEEEFFANHILLCALVPAGSGAESYELDNLLLAEDGSMTMHVTRATAQIGTAVMSQWYFLAEVPRDSLKTTPESFDVLIEE